MFSHVSSRLHDRHRHRSSFNVNCTSYFFFPSVALGFFLVIFPTSLSSSSMSMMSTITITIQRFFFSCCCSFFFFFYSIHAISSTAVEIFFYPLPFHVHLVSIHPSIHPSSDHCYDDPHRTALHTLTHGWFLVRIFLCYDIMKRAVH